MFGRYNTKNLYLVKVAKVTDMKLAGIFEKGWTRYHKCENRYYFAKKAKVKSLYDKDGYQLILSGHKVYGKHQDTEQIGDLFVYDKLPVIDYNHKYISKKTMIYIEQRLEKELSDENTGPNDRVTE